MARDARVILGKNQAGNGPPVRLKRSFRLTGVGVGANSREMPSPAIANLLILQDRDTKRLGLEAQLKAVPGDIARVEARIAAEKAAIDAAKHELRTLESKKKILETEIGSADDRLDAWWQRATPAAGDTVAALDEIAASSAADLASMSVATRVLRSLVRAVTGAHF